MKTGSANTRIAAIRLDNQRTWPEAVTQLMESRLSDLSSYEKERQRLDKLAETDELLRVNRPPNPYESIYNSTIAAVSEELTDQRLVGYHCTRLHPAEIANVASSGLRPLSAQFLERRIIDRRDAGDIPWPIAQRLLNEHYGNWDSRRGVTWFVFHRRLLKEPHGIKRFFKSWGGEALYCGREDDPDIGPVLRSIGTPCIVEADVLVNEIDAIWGIGMRFYDVFMHARRVSTGRSIGMEGRIAHVQPVRRVMTNADRDFHVLTGNHFT